jgi:hypothetical protein
MCVWNVGLTSFNPLQCCIALICVQKFTRFSNFTATRCFKKCDYCSPCYFRNYYIVFFSFNQVNKTFRLLINPATFNSLIWNYFLNKSKQFRIIVLFLKLRSFFFLLVTILKCSLIEQFLRIWAALYSPAPRPLLSWAGVTLDIYSSPIRPDLFCLTGVACIFLLLQVR